MKIQVPALLIEITEALIKKGARPILVGGAVRDFFFGQPVKDLDIEVFNIDASDALKQVLQRFGSVVAVGKAFGVLKLVSGDQEYDFALPRKDNKVGVGHKGFNVELDPGMDFREAARRRDFTINSMGYDFQSRTILDPFDGQQDLKNKVLRHISDQFSEDPLRVLRAMQFAARFEFQIHPSTLELCQSIDLTELPKERLFDEFKKLLLKARKPSLGFEFAESLGILSLFPELQALKGVPQDPQWHPEGDVWVHTMMVVDEMARLKTGEDRADLIYMLAALCHDLGKPATTEFTEGRIRTPNHERAGADISETFLRRLTDEQDLIDQVKPLVAEHLKPALLYKDNQKHTVSNAAIRRLALRVNIEKLLKVAKADHLGRALPPQEMDFPEEAWLLDRAKNLSVHNKKPESILKGRHLIDLGFSPGPEFGRIINSVFELQLDGTITTLEEAISYVKSNRNNLS